MQKVRSRGCPEKSALTQKRTILISPPCAAADITTKRTLRIKPTAKIGESREYHEETKRAKFKSLRIMRIIKY